MMAKPEEQNFGEMLIEGLREALAIARGEMDPSRVTIHRVPKTPPPAED
jgi:hypothetical protein